MGSQYPPIPPLAIPNERRALSRMYIELTTAFFETTGQPTSKLDANVALCAVAVMLGHADGHPMNKSEIAHLLHMPRQSVARRLDGLVNSGLIQRVEGRYFLEPHRATTVPRLDSFTLILARAFDVLGPVLLAQIERGGFQKEKNDLRTQED